MNGRAAPRPAVPFEGELTSPTDLAAILDHVPSSVALIDLDLRNRFANWAHALWFGKRPDEVLGLHSRDIVGQEKYLEAKPYFDAVRDGEPQAFERIIVAANGEQWHTVMEMMPYTRGGRVRGVVLLCTDVTGRVRAEFARRELAARIEIIDSHGRSFVDLAESAALRLTEAAAEVSDVAADVGDPDLAAAAEGIAGAVQRLRRVLLDGQDFGPGACSGPEDNIRSTLAGAAEQLGFAPSLVVLGVLDDVDADMSTRIRTVLEATLDNVARHARAQRVAVTVSIEGDALVVVVADDGSGSVRARPGSSLDLLRRAAHDRNGTLVWFINDDDGTTVEWHVPLRATVPVTPTSVVKLAQTGNPASARGIRLPPQDYRNSDTLRIDEDELRAVLDLLPMGLGVWDRQLRNQFMNRAGGTWLGVRNPADVVGRSYAEVADPRTLAHVAPLAQASLTGSHFVMERPYVLNESTQGVARSEYIPRYVGREIVGLYAQVSDISARVRAQSAERSDAERVASMQDRNRVEEDVVHLAIQQLFAAGLKLDLAPDRHTEASARVLDRARETLDRSIAELRTSVVEPARAAARP